MNKLMDVLSFFLTELKRIEKYTGKKKKRKQTVMEVEFCPIWNR